MSYQIVVSYSEIAEEVQEFVALGDHTELILSDLGNGQWRITADTRQFWTDAATPDEARAMKLRIQQLRDIIVSEIDCNTVFDFGAPVGYRPVAERLSAQLNEIERDDD